MTKRELSSTLKNLKFMQRTAQKEEKGKEEEVSPAAVFPSSGIPKKCVVVVEGDPHPVATRGRMSFLSFNPSIDKLNEDLQPEASTMNSSRQSETICTRENGNVQGGLYISEPDSLICDENGDLKRTHGGVAYPNKVQKNFRGNQKSSPNGSHNSHKKIKHEKLDWNVLRSPKCRNKKK